MGCAITWVQKEMLDQPCDSTRGRAGAGERVQRKLQDLAA